MNELSKFQRMFSVHRLQDGKFAVTDGDWILKHDQESEARDVQKMLNFLALTRRPDELAQMIRAFYSGSSVEYYRPMDQGPAQREVVYMRPTAR